MELTENHYKLARKLAKSLYHKCDKKVFCFADVISDAYLALVIASKSYDSSRNDSFIPYAIVMIRRFHIDEYHRLTHKTYENGKRIKNTPVVWVEYDRDYLIHHSDVETRITIHQVLSEYKKNKSNIMRNRLDLFINGTLECGETAKSVFLKDLRQFFNKHGYHKSSIDLR